MPSSSCSLFANRLALSQPPANLLEHLRPVLILHVQVGILPWAVNLESIEPAGESSMHITLGFGASPWTVQYVSF